ncbi:phosphatase PAP2 family protein [Haloferacaceae archaeon DSL9]
MRALGALDLLAPLPDVIVALFALITQLGDAWFLFGALALLYWVGPRWVPDGRRLAATLIALAVAGLAVTLAFKTALALPRPAGASDPFVPTFIPVLFESVYLGAATSSGFGFPSGHAVASTVVYGGLALFSTLWTARKRYAFATAMIVIVSFSRLVLGVHFLVDVVVGAAVGLCVLVLVRALAVRDGRIRPDIAFGIAAVCSLCALAVTIRTGHGAEQVQGAIAVGSALGGVAGWRLVGERVAEAAPTSTPVAVGGLLVAGGLWIAAYVASFPLVVAIATSGAAVVLIVALPLVDLRLKKALDSETDAI